MTNEQAQSAATIKVLVVDDTPEAVTTAARPLEPGGVEEQGLVSWVRHWRVKDEGIPLDKAQKELNRVEGEVDSLLAKMKTSTSTGYQLSQVQVSVGVSAGGSIGVVTAGVQASLTLVYSRPGTP